MRRTTLAARKPAEGQTARVDARRQGGALEIVVGGEWKLDQGWPGSADRAMAALEDGSVRKVRITTGELESWDTALLTFLMALVSRAQKRGLPVVRELPASLEQLVALTFAVKSKEGSGRTRDDQSFFAKVGGALLSLPGSMGNIMAFVGDVVLSFARFVTGRSAMRSADLFDAMYECGVRSLPIVMVTNLLFGLILAFVGAVQLTTFGAQIYVAGLVGIGMLRILGAVMVGVVMAGRIGAAYAALIGTMQVNEEVDAIETLGISPVDFLVLPRILALSLMVPLLTVFADVLGIFGGFLVSITLLDLTPMEYVSATISMVSFKQGIVGLVYASAFGIIIAISGCYHGMRCGRSAQAVGEATTTAVVHSIVGIIVAAALITVICNALGV